MDGLAKGIVLSLLPLSELRGGIPVAMASGVEWKTAFLTCVVANSAVIIPTFIFFDHIHRYLMKVTIYEKIFSLYLERVRKKGEAHFAKHTWEYWALFLFVAIPLPTTGAYTGCVLAWFFEMDRVKSFITITLGVVVAGVIVTAAMSIANLAFLKFVVIQ